MTNFTSIWHDDGVTRDLMISYLKYTVPKTKQSSGDRVTASLIAGALAKQPCIGDPGAEDLDEILDIAGHLDMSPEDQAAWRELKRKIELLK